MSLKKYYCTGSIMNQSPCFDNLNTEQPLKNCKDGSSKQAKDKTPNYYPSENCIVYSSSSMSYNSSFQNEITKPSVPTSMVNAQYQRNNITSQEFQHRLYCNSSVHISGGQPCSSPSIETTNQSIHSNYSHPHLIINSSKQQLPLNRQTSCMPNAYIINNEDSTTNRNIGPKCNNVLIPTQNTISGGSRTCSDENGDNFGTLTLTNPPMVYALHRVVTTAQVQGTVCGSLPSSSKGCNGGSINNENENLTQTVQKTVDIKPCNHVNTVISSANNTSLLMDNKMCAKKYSTERDTADDNSHRLKSGQIVNKNTNASNIENDLASSNVLQRNLQNVIPTCVYLMSRVAVHMEIEGTTECPAQVMLAAALGCEELGIANKLLAQSIFGIWMTSSLLDIQLKPHHKPFLVRVAWSQLLDKYSHGNPVEKKFDEPMIMLKRNVFFSKRDEEKIKDNRILELLYEEAKGNVLNGRYIMEPVHCLMLGGIQARIELGPYNSNSHSVRFFRENQSRFLPLNVAKSHGWSWMPISRKNSAEVKLLEQFKRVPQTATTRKLMRKYLEFCWALPFYGAAFFQGQVEQPVRGLMSFVNHKDIEVIVAVNERGVFIIDPCGSTLLLGLKYEEFSWDFAKPSNMNDEECQTCIFIQFDVIENGMQFSKLIQIFSRQAALIDALISYFADQMIKLKKVKGATSSQYPEEPNLIQKSGNSVLCNKLSRLTLATFDEDGRCIGQMGSLTITY